MQRLSVFINERANHFRRIIPLSVTFFIYLFGWGIVSPIFNIRINEITGNLLLSGIIFSIVRLISIVLNPIVGRLCDRFNPKKILQYSLLSYTVIFLAYAYSHSFWQLFLTAILHSFAYAGLWVSGWTIVRKKTKGPHSQEELSFWATVQNLASLIAPVVGGILISINSWIITYYIASALSLLSAIYVKKINSIQNNKPEKSLKKEWRKFFKNPSLRKLAILTVLLYFIGNGFGAYLTLKLKSDGFTIGEIGIILSLTTIPYVAFPIIVGIVADKYGRKIPTLIGLLLSAGGIFLLTTTTRFTPALFYIFIAYTGFAFVSLSANAELNDLLKLKEAGSFSGIYESVKNTGAVMGPLLTGFIAQATNINYAFLILSAISACSIVILKGFKDY